MDSNASLPGEVERNVSRDNDISCCGKLYQRASSFPAVSRTRQSPWMVFELVEIAQRSWRRTIANSELVTARLHPAGDPDRLRPQK